MDKNLRILLGGEPVVSCTSKAIKPGVICNTILPYIPKFFHIVEPLSSDSASPDSRKYSLISMDYAPLVSYLTSPKKPPYFEFGVQSDETVLIYKVKIRPVIVLTHCLPEEEKGFPSHFKGCVLCAPLYTLVDEDGIMNSNYNKAAIDGITALKYRRVFPLPTHPFLKSQISALRLDQTQPVRAKYLSNPIAQVPNRWLGFIREWFYFYGTGKLRPKLLETARLLLLEAVGQQKAS